MVGGSSYLNGSAIEMINNLITTIMNAGIYASGDSLNEKFEVLYTYPKEKADSTMIFSDMQIRWKKYGTYMLYFVIDGIESNFAGMFTVS